MIYVQAMNNIKLKELSIKGLRGVKTDLIIPFEEKSMVLYGDNGSGKSSIADALEWFYHNKIDHLSGTEIGRNGLEAMRHSALNDNDEGLCNIKFNKKDLDCNKKLLVKKGSLNVEKDNKCEEFEDYILKSLNENLIIRHKNVSEFIVAPLGERLNQLSEIIGFSKVTDTKRLLNKVYKDLDKKLKQSGFESIIQSNQQTLISNLQQNVVSQDQFISAINSLLEKYKLTDKIDSLSGIGLIIDKLKKPVNQDKITTIGVLEQLLNLIVGFSDRLNSIISDYAKFATQYNKVIEDTVSLSNLNLVELLTTGERIITPQVNDLTNCPLCLSDISGVTLLSTIQQRLTSLNKLKKDKQFLETLKAESVNQVQEEINNLKIPLNQPQLKQEIFSEIRNSTINLGVNLKYIKDAFEKANFTASVPEKIILPNKDTCSEIQLGIQNILKKLKLELADNSQTDLIVKLQSSVTAYQEIIKQRVIQKKIILQRDSFEIICNEFGKRQKEGLDAFFNLFSSQINDYYVFMNPGESVENIKLIPVETEDEITGLTIQFDFFDNQVSPPHKYLSESHLNCLGLAFFLASVKAFNKINKFFILDDVISSFDSNHRKRFLDLLSEKFNDYQIILLTHENHFFDYAKVVAKMKGWNVASFKWDTERGTYLSEAKKDLIERIENKLNRGETDKLGNDIREFLEHLCKEIASNIEAKFTFRYNDRNEERMSPELLNEIKSKVDKCSKGDHGIKQIIEPLFLRTLLSNFIGNRDSHDNSFVPSMGDFKAFWKDVMDIQKVFLCNDCKKFLSISFYAEDTKEIKCKCGKIHFGWQK